VDSLNHATTGFLLGYIIFLRNKKVAITVGILFSLISLVPDIGGEYMAHVNNDNYEWYNSAHNGNINSYMQYIPPWFLHTTLDKYSHGLNNRWYAGIWWEYLIPWKWKEMMWLEMTMWLVNIILIIYLFKEEKSKQIL